MTAMNNWKSQALAYAILPRILPRIQTLATSGFATVAYLLAVIYQSVGLLPADHIYLNPRNFGRYGIRHAIAATAGT